MIFKLLTLPDNLGRTSEPTNALDKIVYLFFSLQMSGGVKWAKIGLKLLQSEPDLRGSAVLSGEEHDAEHEIMRLLLRLKCLSVSLCLSCYSWPNRNYEGQVHRNGSRREFSDNEC